MGLIELGNISWMQVGLMLYQDWKRSRILDSMNQKTCLALWGMSQTGKSTLLSQYLDGRRANGNDSALTWRVFVVAGAMTDKTKTRKENQK